MTTRRPYRLDSNHNIIPGGTAVQDVLYTSGCCTGFRALTVSATTYGKQLLFRTRSGGSWFLCPKSRYPSESATNYLTVDTVLGLDLAVEPGETLFYFKTSAGSDALETLVVD